MTPSTLAEDKNRSLRFKVLEDHVRNLRHIMFRVRNRGVDGWARASRGVMIIYIYNRVFPPITYTLQRFGCAERCSIKFPSAGPGTIFSNPARHCIISRVEQGRFKSWRYHGVRKGNGFPGVMMYDHSRFLLSGLCRKSPGLLLKDRIPISP